MVNDPELGRGAATPTAPAFNYLLPLCFCERADAATDFVFAVVRLLRSSEEALLATRALVVFRWATVHHLPFRPCSLEGWPGLSYRARRVDVPRGAVLTVSGSTKLRNPTFDLRVANASDGASSAGHCKTPATHEQETDLAVFTALSAQLQEFYAAVATDPWEASPFGWIKREPSRRIGAIGEGLVKAWAQHEGIAVVAAADAGHDCRLNGVPTEVKFSTLWAGGDFVFQQIRDQSYEVVALLGIEPQAVRLWMVPKAELWLKASGQHTGANAQDTKWLRFPASAPPAWLAPYGGTLSAARRSLEEIERNLAV